MARPDATALPQSGSRTGGLLDPARPSHRWWVVTTVMVSGFLVSMSQTAVQVALPQIMTVFGLDLEHAQWIVTAYVIAGAVLVPAAFPRTANLLERLGWKCRLVDISELMKAEAGLTCSSILLETREGLR